MRLVIRRPDAAKWASERPCLGALLTELGPYCSFCEIRLTDTAFVWNLDAAETVEPDSRVTNPETWQNLYPICSNCEFEVSRSVNSSQLGTAISEFIAFALTHEVFDLSYPMAEPSPFGWDFLMATKTIINSDGSLERRNQKEVLVAAAVRPFAEIADLFALNSRDVNYNDLEIRVTEESDLSLSDRRIEQRTKTWKCATEFCQRLQLVAELQGMGIAEFLETELALPWALQAKIMAGYTGFWTVWADLLWRTTRNRRFLESSLWNDPRSDEQIGTINPLNPFPATRRMSGIARNDRGMTAQ